MFFETLKKPIQKNKKEKNSKVEKNQILNFFLF
jgi:hypothetical protein